MSCTNESMQQGHEAPKFLAEWRSWKVKRNCRRWNLLFFLLEIECSHGVELTRSVEYLSQSPSLHARDCKCVYDALERNLNQWSPSCREETINRNLGQTSSESATIETLDFMGVALA